MTISKRCVDHKGGTIEIKDVILTRVSERGISIAELARRSSVNYQLLRNSLHSDRLLKADELIRVSAELGWDSRLRKGQLNAGTGLKEKDINLAIMLACQAELVRHGVTVVRSRTTDENDPVAQEVAEASLEYFGIAYKVPVVSNPQPSGKLHRVQVRALSVKENAEKLAAEPNAKGYQTIIKAE